jgi:hypothetical protein
MPLDLGEIRKMGPERWDSLESTRVSVDNIAHLLELVGYNLENNNCFNRTMFPLDKTAS